MPAIGDERPLTPTQSARTAAIRWNLVKLFALTTLILCGGLNAKAVDTAGPAQPLTWPALLDAVRTNNPAIKSARSMWQASRQRIPQAKAWEDPRFGVTLERMGTTRPDRVRDAEWTISQAIPISGANRVQGRIAETEANQVSLEIRKQELESVAKAKAAGFALLNAQRQLQITDNSITILDQIAESIRNKYRAGLRTQSDALMAETELAKLQETRFDLRQQIAGARSELEQLTRLTLPESLSLELPKTLPNPPVLHELQQKAMTLRPEIIAATLQTNRAELKIQLANRSRIPNPEFMIAARTISGTGQAITEMDTGISLPLPWFNRGKYRAMVSEARHEAEANRYDLERIQTETLRAVRDGASQATTFHHHYTLYASRVLPLARQALEASRISFENDRSSVIELLNAQHSLHDAESMYWSHMSDYLRAIAMLEPLVGTELLKP